jgi:small-conductance mechanosensitive channel
MQATAEQAETLTEPKPLVTFDGFGDNALMFEVTFCRAAILGITFSG